MLRNSEQNGRKLSTLATAAFSIGSMLFGGEEANSQTILPTEAPKKESALKVTSENQVRIEGVLSQASFSKRIRAFSTLRLEMDPSKKIPKDKIILSYYGINQLSYNQQSRKITHNGTHRFGVKFEKYPDFEPIVEFRNNNGTVTKPRFGVRYNNFAKIVNADYGFVEVVSNKKSLGTLLLAGYKFGDKKKPWRFETRLDVSLPYSAIEKSKITGNFYVLLPAFEIKGHGKISPLFIFQQDNLLNLERKGGRIGFGLEIKF